MLYRAAMHVLGLRCSLIASRWKVRSVACAGPAESGDGTFKARKQPRLDSSVDVHRSASAEVPLMIGIAAAPEVNSGSHHAHSTVMTSGSRPVSAVNGTAMELEGEPNGVTAAIDAGTPGVKPYLCTGFDCYLVREPCVMCAMALVHSRVRRVVYSEADPEWGALGGSLKLHGQRSLNHHYAVYHLPRTRP